MTTQSDFSTSNVKNSIAGFLGAALLQKGYVVYWHENDGLETLDGYYGQWSTRQATLLTDSVVAPRIAAAAGLITIKGPITASPRFVTRPTFSGAVDEQDEIPVPAIAIDVGAAAPIANYELGSRLQWRSRHLIVHAFARTEPEQSLFQDFLAETLDEDTMIDILDHDGGTQNVVGNVRMLSPTTEGSIRIPGPESTTFAVELNARLEYVA